MYTTQARNEHRWSASPVERQPGAASDRWISAFAGMTKIRSLFIDSTPSSP
ncbi:hypothetical protein H8L32_26665 [Undibacterium sp. CY18W]|uniref:Uncharacterized protein n=1 Tax=Undibacterium hunanense TaxID=2762292 RepID=A0ABR6ZZJ0_9BURK|nr:hypothetical protein [Undibacterium hunanense]MBC3921074.1 hypothetical protein [Undibacterium hunanense]